MNLTPKDYQKRKNKPTRCSLLRRNWWFFLCVWLHLRLFELRPIIRKQGEGTPKDGKPFKKLNGLFKWYPHGFSTLEKVVIASKVLWVSREEKKIKQSSSWLAILRFIDSLVLWIILLLTRVIVGAVLSIARVCPHSWASSRSPMLS